MKAIVHKRYGRPELLELRDIDEPVIEGHQVLLRVHASSINPVEWYQVTGPWFARFGNGLRKPKTKLVGADVAGRIEAVGADVKDFRPGDEVFGTTAGAWAEYAAAREVRLAPKPPNVSFEEAAAVPVAAITALQALRDKGRVQAGQRVLINGASGGVGTFAVQLAKAFGADVTGVCSTQNVELVRSLGADRVVDYTHEDFTLRKRASRPDARHRGQPLILGGEARIDARGDRRARWRTDDLSRDGTAAPSRENARGFARPQPVGEVLRRENHQRGPRGAASADRGGNRKTRHRQDLRAEQRSRSSRLLRRRTRSSESRHHHLNVGRMRSSRR